MVLHILDRLNGRRHRRIPLPRRTTLIVEFPTVGVWLLPGLEPRFALIVLLADAVGVTSGRDAVIVQHILLATDAMDRSTVAIFHRRRLRVVQAHFADSLVPLTHLPDRAAEGGVIALQLLHDRGQPARATDLRLDRFVVVREPRRL